MKTKLSFLTGLLISLNTLPAIAASYPTGNWTHVPAREMLTRVTRADGSKASYTLDAERLDGGWYEAMPRDIAIDADPAAGTMEAYLNDDDSMVFELRDGLFSNVVSRLLSVTTIPGYNCQQKLRATYLFHFQRDNRNGLQMGFTEQLIDTAATNNCQKYLSDGIRNPSILKIFTADNSPARNLLDSGFVSESDFVNTRMIHMYNNFQGQLYSANTGLLARCGTEEGTLTRFPVLQSNLDHIVPPGGATSVAKIIPGPELRFIMKRNSIGNLDPVYAPGKIRAYSVDRTFSTAGVKYVVRLRGCREMKIEFQINVATRQISDAITASAREGNFSCNSIVENKRTISTTCSYQIKLDFAPGEYIGAVRRGEDLIMYVTDKRVNSSFIHPEYYSSQYTKSSCFADYFAPAAKQAMYAKMGVKTAAGFVQTGCGRVDYDIKGKAIGNWFQQGNFKVGADNLHFGPVLHRPDQLVAVFGEGFDAAVKGRFLIEKRAQNAARINLDFSSSALYKINCYENLVEETTGRVLEGAVLLLLPTVHDKLIVAIDRTRGTCPAGGVTSMPANSRTYQR
jgi:hypothetical protein